jgi:hypothetical protein
MRNHGYNEVEFMLEDAPQIEPQPQERLRNVSELLTSLRYSLTRDIGTAQDLLSHIDTETIVTWTEKCSNLDIDSLPELFRLYYYQEVLELQLSPADPERSKKIDSARERQQRVLLSLTFKELNRIYQPEQMLRANAKEFYYQLLKSLSINIRFLTPGEIAYLGQALNLMIDEDPSRDSYFPEYTLQFQTLQRLCPYAFGLETIVTRNNYENDYQLQPYPEEQTESLVDSEKKKDKHDDDTLLCLIISLTSPYLCELGDSELGRRNLRQIREKIPNCLELLSKISDEKKKTIAERSINALDPGEAPTAETVGQFSIDAQKWLMDYFRFRQKRPLAADRFSSERESYESDGIKELDFSACISINPNYFIKFVQSGYKYRSSHELATSGGHSSMASKSIGEAATNLLATGLPGDPYIRYAYAQEKQPWGEKWRKTQYGGITLVLKDAAIANCLSATEIDSLQSVKLPVTDIHEMNRMFHAWTPHPDQPPNVDYMELQVAKAITAEDIETIVVDPLELRSAYDQTLPFGSGAQGVDPEQFLIALRKLQQDYPSIQLKDINGNPFLLETRPDNSF